MTIAVWDPTAGRDLDGIRHLLETGQITGAQASEMIVRVHRRRRAIASTPGPGHPIPPGPGPAAGPGQGVPGPAASMLRGPVPLERLRRLSPEDAWQALLFLSGMVPGAVETALAAVLTPLSTAGTAAR